MLKNKIAAITICVFFVLSMTGSMILVPNVNAHSPPWNIPTYAYIEVIARGVLLAASATSPGHNRRRGPSRASPAGCPVSARARAQA